MDSRSLGRWVLVVACLGTSMGAAAQGAAAYLSATCANCHGMQGRAVPGMASLAGRPQADLVAAMRDFKSGARPATVMHQLAKGYTDAQIEAIAGFFAQQARP